RRGDEHESLDAANRGSAMRVHWRLSAAAVAGTVAVMTVAVGVAAGRTAVSAPQRAATAPAPALSAGARAVQDFGRLPAAFVENRGQADRRVRYYAQGDGVTV